MTGGKSLAKPTSPEDPPAAQQVTIARSQSSYFSGPLPPPEELAKYEAVYPGAARQLFEDARAQQLHRHGIENRAIDASIKSRYLGQILTALVALAVMGVSGIFAYTGQSAYGLAAVVAAMATLGGVFVYADTRNRNERLEKNKILAGQSTETPQLPQGGE